MEVKVIEKEENPLLEREKINFEVEHKNAPTPPRADVLKELSEEIGVSEDLIVIEKIATLHGRQVASGIARIYKTEKRLKELEPEYLTTRTETSKEKLMETEEKAEEKEEEKETEKESEEETEEETESKEKTTESLEE